MLSVVMLSVVGLKVVMLSVVAPSQRLDWTEKFIEDKHSSLFVRRFRGKEKQVVKRGLQVSLRVEEGLVQVKCSKPKTETLFGPDDILRPTLVTIL
jgi:hypothetical protein